MVAGPRTGGDAVAPEAPRTERLTSTTVSAVAWQGLSFVLGRLLVLVATVILARVLGPEDFGLVSLALVFVGFVSVMSDFGVSQALIYRQHSPRAADAALACTVVSGILLGAITAAAAPLVAEGMGNPAITDFLRVLGLTFVLSSFGIVPDVLLRRDLLFRRRTVVQLASQTSLGIVSIVLALGGVGPWSLVYGQLASAGVMSVVAWSRVRYRPDLRWWRLRWSDVRPLLAFGLPTAGNGLLATVILNVDYVVVSHLLGAKALGYYMLAFRVPEMVIVSTFQVVSQVVFPVFSRTRGEPERMRRGYVRMWRLQTMYGVVLGCVLAALAPYLVPAVFGPGWGPSVLPLQALAIYAAFRSLGMGVVDVLKSMGRPNLALLLSVARFVVLLPALILATKAGINGVAIAQVVIALVFALLMQLVCGHLLGVPAGRLVGACAPAVAAGIASAVGAWVVAGLTPGGDLVKLAAGVVTAGVISAVILLGLSTSTRRELRSLLPRRLAGSRSA